VRFVLSEPAFLRRIIVLHRTHDAPRRSFAHLLLIRAALTAWAGGYAGKVGFWGALDDLEVGSVPAYIVEYGLRNPDENHPRLSRAIKERYRYWRILEFTWIIDASESASKIYDYLEPNIDQDDKLFVCQLAGDAAMADIFSDKGAAWLEQIL
jgi:hypothetical protein